MTGKAGAGCRSTFVGGCIAELRRKENESHRPTRMMPVGLSL